MGSNAERRYAIYFAPSPGSALESFGRRWFEERESAAALGLDPTDFHEITETARHYGFHATLKPPFRLREGRTLQALLESAQRFAEARTAFVAPPLTPASLGRFIALRPTEPSPVLDRLASDCVREFDGFRCSPGETELARRRQAGLSARQESLLALWGYPYVQDEFRFHMTLTGPLEETKQTRLLTVLRDACADVAREPLTVDAVSIFVQEDRARPFRALKRLPLAPTPRP
jgi:putative phosphonate metabolism protein